MNETVKNPFLIAGYHSPTYFCDREVETNKIISALTNDRNISLISARRMGKTGLIHHVFYKLAEQEEVHCFYIDIFSTQNLHEFVTLLGKAVIGKLDSTTEVMIRNITSVLQSFRPSFTFDTVTGAPSVSLDFQSPKTEIGLQEIFEYLKNSGKRCYIAIDEFQQITEYPEKGVEALLRSYMQFLPNVKFIFSGSKKHLMDALFSSANRPFYQSTQKIGLQEIPIDTYRLFAIEKFRVNNKTISTEIFDSIYTRLSGHTWYIQFVLNQLFALQKNEYSEIDIQNIIGDVLMEENSTYKTYCELMSKGQLRLIRAIASEKKITEPYESSFMQKHALTAPSSVRLALNALIEKSLVLKGDDGYYCVYDRFFSIWLTL